MMSIHSSQTWVDMAAGPGFLDDLVAPIAFPQALFALGFMSGRSRAQRIQAYMSNISTRAGSRRFPGCHTDSAMPGLGTTGRVA
jgi:hypothetical protein